MHITLTGNLGSGKSTLGKILAEKYGYEIYSTGTVIRKIAEEQGVSVLEMNKLMESDSKYDHMIDDTTARISREMKEKNILFDSRLAWHFVEESFKVFLSVNINEAARRVYADASRGDVESYASVEECAARLTERAQTEDRRYRELYNIEYFDYSNYNLVLDSCETPEVLAKVLVTEAKRFEEETKKGLAHKTRIVMGKNRPEKDFEKERANGKTYVSMICGKDFVVTEL